MEDTNEKKNFIEGSSQGEQLGILVLDGSGTMNDPGEKMKKCEEVNKAVQELIGRLNNSSRTNEFFISVVIFDENVEVREECKKVTKIDKPGNNDYNPLHGHGGLTAIGDALSKANEIAEEFLAGQTEYPRSVVIILMTDGHNNRGSDPIDVAKNIMKSGKHIGIFTVGFGQSDKDINIQILKEITSDEGSYMTYNKEKNIEDLRTFFLRSLDVDR